MSFETIRQTFISFLGLKPQCDQSSQESIPQELNSQYQIQNKFIQIEKKQHPLNPYKKSLIRLNEYQKSILKQTDCSKCPTIQYELNQIEKPVIDHSINNPRWKKEDQSYPIQRLNSLDDLLNPIKHTKNKPYDQQTISSSINFQKNQILQCLINKPINRNKNSSFDEKKKKSSQNSTENVIFNIQNEPYSEIEKQTIQKSDNHNKSNEKENNNLSESIIIKKQPITKFNKIIKQELHYDPNTSKLKLISPNKIEEQQQQISDTQIQQFIQVSNEQNFVSLDKQESLLQNKQEPLEQINQESINQQIIEQQIQQKSIIEINPFTSNMESILFNAPWITNQPEQNQSTFNLYQSQPIQNQYQTTFIQQQQQPIFLFQNESQLQQNQILNQTFFSQQIQPSSNPFISNQFNQNFYNQNNIQQQHDLFGYNQQKQELKNNSFLFQTNSLGGGSFSGDDQNKSRTIDLFSVQQQSKNSQVLNNNTPANLFVLDNNTQEQVKKESDRYKNKFKQNTIKYNSAAQRME